MLRVILLLTLSSACMPVCADALPTPLPDTLYFSPSWCPKKEELIVLSKHLELTMNRCCILKATPLPETISNPEVLAPWSRKIYTKNSDLDAPCVGLTEEEVAENEKLARIKEEESRAYATQFLRDSGDHEFCEVYGHALRKGEVIGLGSFPDIMKYVKKEAKRRGLRFDDSLVRKGHIKIGISECQLFASWGITGDQNESVGRWGVHAQYVYGGGTYVYMENGKVTSWQNSRD